ncbi:PDZ domain-containing protein [Pedobacter sp. HDW13]|uniref:S1C family serine protease n=1 Tax=Pedobacter sp. HDW13 TaxID=2714940 RepID=UPI0014093D64|nr:trypsin-like peptidase domain-containing protein [Pedobacter sp. HDW13]QIL41366.1 PDZ domain-containing protein [Pedobacter sp. HDW13]
MTRHFRLLALCVLLFSTNVFAQQKVESIISAAVKKAYPASVRMWGFDTTRNERTSAQFSGVVVSADGYILTAAHTVQPGRNYKVFFTDGREAIAEALGKIEVKETPGAPDVAMMKILTKGNWPYAEMGYSQSLVKNEMCLSIAYPESLNQKLPTLRLGKIAEVKNTYGFIQSTCKMEPGDSGGPLFDYLGRVIGLHSAIDVAEDMNFEIPVDLYRKYWSALQQEKIYTAFPDQTDLVKVDNLAEQIKKDTESGKIDFAKVKFSPKFKNASFEVSSRFNGEVKTIGATLFNLTDATGTHKQVLVTKNSMIGEAISLKFNDKTLNLSVIARDKENDLILLGLNEAVEGGIDLKGIKPAIGENPVGQLLFTAKYDATYLQSVWSSTTLSLPKVSAMPYFGAMVAYNTSPAVFSLIKAESPAELAGLKMGDELVSIDGQAIAKSTDFVPFMVKYWPDDEITLKWTREGKPFVKTVKLAGIGQGSSNHPAEKFAGGKSARRDGFNAVHANDLALTPDLNGSPVFDTKGNFCGLNIARFSRTAALFLPAIVIYNFVTEHVK